MRLSIAQREGFDGNHPILVWRVGSHTRGAGRPGLRQDGGVTTGEVGTSVRVEREGPVTVVTIDRPEVRNAVDRPTARGARRRLPGVRRRRHGGGRGAHRRRRHVLRRGRPQGHGSRRTAATGSSPTATARWGRPGCGSSQAGDRRGRGSRRRRRARAGALVRPAGGRTTTRSSACSAAAGACRSIDGGTVRLPRLIGPVASPRPDPHRRVRSGPRRRSRSGWSTGWSRPVHALAGARALAAELAALPQTCLRHDLLSCAEQWALPSRRRWPTSSRHGQVSLTREAVAGAIRFAEGEGRHGA